MDDEYSIGQCAEITNYFVGKIPPFLLFEMEYHSLFHLVESHKNDDFFSKPNIATEMAVVGMVAHFEAFCKHQFGSIINIVPELQQQFVANRRQPNIVLSTIASLKGELLKKIGFIIAEQYDFGSAIAINSLFNDLLQLTPFSADEINKFNGIVYNRNLLVHHAGFYTMRYLKNKTIEEINEKAFHESVVVTTEGFHEIGEFLFEMAIKISRESSHSINRMYNANTFDQYQVTALNELLRGLYGVIE